MRKFTCIVYVFSSTWFHSFLPRSDSWKRFTMYLMYYLDGNGDRVYTLKKVDPKGRPTASAHPARFSPEDKFSRERIMTKRRFYLLPTQQPQYAC